MKKIYRGWWLSNIDKKQVQAVKGREKIIGTREQVQREIDKRALDELRKFN